ncbi:MAG: ARMT1-like domain-containing protein [Candidatus Omnitrophota bacterium]
MIKNKVSSLLLIISMLLNNTGLVFGKNFDNLGREYLSPGISLDNLTINNIFNDLILKHIKPVKEIFAITDFAEHDQAKVSLLRRLFLKNAISTEEFINIILTYLDRSTLPRIQNNIANPPIPYKYGRWVADTFKEGPASKFADLIERRNEGDLRFLNNALDQDENTRSKFTKAIKTFLSLPQVKKMANLEIMEVSLAITRIATNGVDPAQKIKNSASAWALSLKDYIRALIDNADDSLEAALRLSAIGNFLDFSDPKTSKKLSDDGFSLEKLISVEFEKENFWAKKNRENIDILKSKISAKKQQKVFIAVDNAGETEIDIFSIVYELLEQGHQVILAGKTLPATNNSTKVDILNLMQNQAIRELLGEKIKNITVIDSGTLGIGFDLARMTDECKMVFLAADLVIFKGQANYACVRDFNLAKDYFLILRTKWPEELSNRYQEGEYVIEFVEHKENVKHATVKKDVIVKKKNLSFQQQIDSSI